MPSSNESTAIAFLLSMGFSQDQLDAPGALEKITKALQEIPQVKSALLAQEDLDSQLNQAVLDRDLDQMASLLQQGASPGDESEGAFELAMRLEEPSLAQALLKFSVLSGKPIDLYNTLISSAEKANWPMLQALCDDLNEGQLYRAVYYAQRSEIPLSDYAFLLEAAQARSEGDWSARAASGLLRHWDERPKGHYEIACDQLRVPAWSKACAERVDQREKEIANALTTEPERVDRAPRSMEPRPHRSLAIGQPFETLLFDRPFFDFWEAELDASQRSADLNDLKDLRSQWSSTVSTLPKLLSLWESLSEAPTPQKDALFARAIVAAQAQRFAPFIMAWGVHQSFTAERAQSAPKAINACLIDRLTIGALSENIAYGSFNARVAVIAISCREAGRMDDDAALILNARLRDLSENSVVWKRFTEPPMAADIQAAKSYFEAQALAIELACSLPPGRSASRPRV